jgi:DNA-binding MarR family transcriptional regulator
MAVTPGRRRVSSEEGEVRLIYAIGRLDRAIRRELRLRLAKELDLTVPQFTALTVLRSRSGLSNAQLARRSLVTPQAMQEVIAALEARGLIERTQAAHHQRILQTKLTAEGRRIARRGDRIVDELEGLMLVGVSPAEHRRFLASVRRADEFLRAGLNANQEH